MWISSAPTALAALATLCVAPTTDASSRAYAAWTTSDGRARSSADLTCSALRRSRSEEHTSELQSLMRISYAVFCLKKKKHHLIQTTIQKRLHHPHNTSTP